MGGGFGGVYALRSLHARFHKDRSVSMTIVNENNYFLFAPFLHEIATGGIAPSTALEPLRQLFPCCAIDVHVTSVKEIMFDQRMVATTNGAIEYDYLIVALGARTNYFGVRGASEHAFTLKTLDDALRLKRHCIRLFERAVHCDDSEQRRKLLRFVIVGGGPTGVELAGELSEFIHDTFAKEYPREVIKDVQIILLHRDHELIAQFHPAFRREALRVLSENHVTVRLGAAATEVGSNYLVINESEQLDTATVVWVTGIAPYEFGESTRAVCDSYGRIDVEPTLQIAGHPDAYAIGDCACFVNPGETRPLPALAQVAVQQGTHVGENIFRCARGKAPKPFRYHKHGMMISIGRWKAFAEVGPFRFKGAFAWWLWRTVYLSKIISMEKRIRIAIDWTLDLFRPRDISEF